MDGSNVDATFIVAKAELSLFIDRIEASRARQAEEKAEEKLIWDELKGRGYTARPVRTIIKERAMDPDKLAEEQALLELYRSALAGQ